MPRKGKVATEKETLAYMTEVLRDGVASADERLRAGQALMRHHARMAELAHPQPVEIVDDITVCEQCVFHKFGEWYYNHHREAVCREADIIEALERDEENECSEKK